MNLLFTAELTKLAGRPSARLALVALVLLGASGPLLLLFGSSSHVSLNGVDIAEKMDLSVPNAIGWSLAIRGFYLGQTALLLLASQSWAGEYAAHTLRDELVRPVSRTAVLAAKALSLAAFSLVTHAGALLVAALVGLIALRGGDGDWGRALAATAAAWVCEVAFLPFAFAVPIVTRSVAGGLAGAFLFVLLERLLTYGLVVLGWVADAMPPQLATVPEALRAVVELSAFLPSAGWTAWADLARGDGVLWQHWVALLAWAVGAAVVADRTFARSDIP